MAVWGILGYCLFFTLLILFKPKNKQFSGLAILCVLAGIFSLFSIVLALVSFFYVRSYCLMCIASYGINFLLLLITWMAQKRFGDGSFRNNLKTDIQLLNRKCTRVFFIAISFMAISLTAFAFYPNYWLYKAIPEDPNIESGITEDGNPWIGAQEPVLTIVEFTDYMCFQCGKMHGHLRRLVSEYPGKIRLVHRHFPLDHFSNPLIKEPIHNQSGLVSLLAIYAQEQNKFWKINDILFREAREKKAFDFDAILKEEGLDLSRFQESLKEGRLVGKLAADIRSAALNGITATPSYLIDGKLYSGVIPEDVFYPVIK